MSKRAVIFGPWSICCTRYFGRDGRDEADALLERRSGNPDKPRILEAFNQPCDDWLNFFCFTMFTDRDGKYQLSALAESGFEPLARTCQFMLTEEAHHMFVGDTGTQPRSQAHGATDEAEGDVRELGGIPLDIIQKYINFWFSYSLDLFGGEISSNSADFFAAGLKGRYKEQEQYEDHVAANEIVHYDSGREWKVGDARSPAAKRAERSLARRVCEGLREGFGALEQDPGRRRHRANGFICRTRAFIVTWASLPVTLSTSKVT